MRLNSLEKIIRVFLQTIDRDKELEEFIENISGGNIRLALDLVRSFFGSGHVNTHKIVKVYEDTGTYFIPLHEFLRAVIYGDSQYFDSEQSPIANLFDLSTADPKEHFLIPLIIGLLISPSGHNVEEGFVETAVMYDRLQGLGFTAEQIDFALVRAVRKKLVETSARRMPEPGQVMPQALRVTSVGVYHNTRLCKLFTYMDAILTDTPILDSHLRGEIEITSDVKVRLSNVETFRRYLDLQWARLDNSKASSLFNWLRASADLQRDLEKIHRKVSRFNPAPGSFAV